MLMKKKHCTPQQRPIFYLTEDPEDPADFEDPAQIPKIPFALAVSAGIVRDRQGSSGSVRERQGASGIVRVVRDRQGASGSVRERQGSSGSIRDGRTHFVATIKFIHLRP